MLNRRTPAQIRQIVIVFILVSLLWPSLALGASSKTKKTRLQLQRKSISTRITAVRSKLRQVKRVEYQKRSELRGVEHRLRIARGQLQYATLRVERAKIEVQRASSALNDAQRQFSTAQQAVGNRLIALHEQGDQGYLELLLAAEDYGDLLQRSEFATLMMEQDRDTLRDLQTHKEKVARYQQAVTQKRAELASWKQQVAVLHNRTDIQRRVAANDLSDVRSQRARIEGELTALERESNAIAAMLRAMQSSAAGQRRYNQRYAGGIGGLPVAGRITSPFGYRYHPILKRNKMHTGVDIAAPSGTPIGAGGGGEVIFAGWRGGYGNTVIIDHGGGRTTLYAHMSSIAVRVGQVVSRRQLVGRVGSTGLSTGPHLHYEARRNGSPVNPL